MKGRIELNDSGIIFNEAEHTYYDPFADKYLSGITTAIHNQLAKEEFDSVPKNILDEATERGKQCHASIEKFTTQWIDDGSQSVKDFIQLCNENNICSEAAEYTVTDFENYASNIDLVARVGDSNVFDLYDVKTFSKINATKLLTATYQLSIYAYLFELVNPDATVGRLAILHIRNTDKEHISELVEVKRLPVETVKDLLQCELEGRQFVNDPLGIPEDIKNQEDLIRSLLTQKAEIESQLNDLKADIFQRMQTIGAKQWSTDTMKLTIKAGSSRSSFNVRAYQADNPDIDLTQWYKTTEVGPSLLIAV